MNIHYTDHNGILQVMGAEEVEAIRRTGRNSWEHYAVACDPSDPPPFWKEQVIAMAWRPGKVKPSPEQYVSDTKVEHRREQKLGLMHWLRYHNQQTTSVNSCGTNAFTNGASYGALRFQKMTTHARVCPVCRYAFLMHYKDKPMPDYGRKLRDA